MGSSKLSKVSPFNSEHVLVLKSDLNMFQFKKLLAKISNEERMTTVEFH
jgi:hypothetical protein